MDHDDIPIKVLPGTMDRLLIWTGKEDRSISRSKDGRTCSIDELDPVMWFAPPLVRRCERISSLHRIIRRGVDRSLENEMPIHDAEIHGEWIAWDGRRCCRHL